MAKNSKKIGQTNRASETNRIRGRLARLLYRPKMLLFLSLAVSCAVVAPLVLDALPDLSQRQEYRLRTSEIVFSNPPNWVAHDLLRQVIERAGLPQEVSLLEDGLAEEIAKAFELHPWVEEVIFVRKSIPARLEVELSYRRPVAMVQGVQGMYPVDGSGTLLPPADFSVADTKRYPVIQNVKSTPQGAAGTNWGDLNVVAAARLADTLAVHWQEFGLVAIRVPQPGNAQVTFDDLIYELITAGGSTIIWGRVPGSDHPGELSADQKIGRLKKYLTDFDSFVHPHGPYEIDIRHWQEISRRPLSARNTRTRR